jgi:NTE family protein
MTRKFLFACLTLLPMLAGAAVPKPTGISDERLSTDILWDAFLRLKPTERPRVVLVLGGGGAKGLSHIGVLRVFEEEKIPVDEIIGVSVGALVGAVYAGGVTTNQLDVMASEIGWDKLSDVSSASMMRLVLNEELLSSSKMETYLNRYIGGKTFADLRIPFTCIATDIRNGEAVIFKEGPVAIAARASATFPAVFAPVDYRQRQLVDGGIVDNLPTDIVAKGTRDVVVAIAPLRSKDTLQRPSIFRSLVQTIEIQKNILTEQRKQNADFVIEPDVSGISTVDLGRSRESIEAGTLAAHRSALELKKLLIKRLLASRTSDATR